MFEFIAAIVILCWMLDLSRKTRLMTKQNKEMIEELKEIKFRTGRF